MINFLELDYQKSSSQDYRVYGKLSASTLKNKTNIACPLNIVCTLDVSSSMDTKDPTSGKTRSS